MIGKTTLAAALLLATTALAQQQGTSPTQQNPSTQNQMSGQCWDTATNQVKNRGTVGSNTNSPKAQTGGSPSQSPGGSTSSQSPNAGQQGGGSTASQRPAP